MNNGYVERPSYNHQKDEKTGFVVGNEADDEYLDKVYITETKALKAAAARNLLEQSFDKWDAKPVFHRANYVKGYASMRSIPVLCGAKNVAYFCMIAPEYSKDEITCPTCRKLMNDGKGE